MVGMSAAKLVAVHYNRFNVHVQVERAVMILTACGCISVLVVIEVTAKEKSEYYAK